MFQSRCKRSSSRNAGFRREIEPLFELDGLSVRDPFVMFGFGTSTANSDVRSPIPNGERVGTHASEIARYGAFDTIDGSENSNQSRNADGDDEHGENGSEQLASDRAKGDFDVLYDQLAVSVVHVVVSSLRKVGF
jgi:hypothetical protein